MNTTILNREFQHPGDDWYHIEALGRHPHAAAGVVQVIDAEAAQAIVHCFNAEAAAGTLRHGREMLIDHEHFSDQPDQETRAYGWLQELQARADGIYGRIRWTTTGRAAVDGGDYRFFSTEYEPQDLTVLNAERRTPNAEGNPDAESLNPAPECPRVRPVRLGGLTLTNMNNNRGQKPITNRFSGVGHPPAQTLETHGQAARATTNTTKGTSMKSVCTLLGLSADADETAIHLAVAKLLNRGDIAPDALAALRAEHQALTEQNHRLLSEESDALLDGCGVREERLRNRLKAGLKPLASREERLGYLADFGYEPGRGQAAAAFGARVLNRGTGTAREATTATGEGEQAVALRIQNRAGELQGKGLKYDAAWNQARREVLNH
jgi:hypothetical protein